MIRNLEIRGGYMTGEKDESKDAKASKSTKNSNNSGGVFMEKRCEVVPEDKIGVFFCRDWEMCGMPKIMICPTTRVPTVQF